MKRKLVHAYPYSHISVLSVDMSNPIHVFYFARRVREVVKRIDVLFLNNSVVNIESMDWNVMYSALRSKSISYFFTTGRYKFAFSIIFRDIVHNQCMITPGNLGVNEYGMSIEFCQQVLCPFILVLFSILLL